jgi:hypothetical protein
LLSDEPQRVGVLVIRVWLEPAGGGVIARITGRRDVLSADDETIVVTGDEAAVAVVRDWILAFEHASGDSP